MADKQVWQKNLLELSDEQFEATFKTNVFAMFWIIKAALPHLGPGSTIINTASLEAYAPAPDRLDFGSTKGAIINFSKGLAQQLVSLRIRVNVVAPAYVSLASAESSFVVGETLDLNGGMVTP